MLKIKTKLKSSKPRVEGMVFVRVFPGNGRELWQTFTRNHFKTVSETRAAII
jgi:hypothetical protein